MDAQERDSVGWYIRRARTDLGLSQEELARRIGSKREYVSQIESGSPKWPGKYIDRLAEALDVSVESLEVAAGRRMSPTARAAQEWAASATTEEEAEALQLAGLVLLYATQTIRKGKGSEGEASERTRRQRAERHIHDLADKLGVDIEIQETEGGLQIKLNSDSKTFSAALDQMVKMGRMIGHQRGGEGGSDEKAEQVET